MKKMVASMALVFALGSMNACDFPSSCEGLTVSDQDREAAANGYEVEREDDLGNECQLSEDGQTWSVDD